MKATLIKKITLEWRIQFFAFAIAIGISQVACGVGNIGRNASVRLPNEVANEGVDSMKISIKVGNKTVTATLIDSETTREFVSLLPLKLTMDDLFGREKFAHLPRAISGEGQRTRTYEVGDVVYWSPGPDVAIFYRHDSQKIPAPGIIVIGKIDSGVEALNVAGSVEVIVELVK